MTWPWRAARCASERGAVQEFRSSGNATRGAAMSFSAVIGLNALVRAAFGFLRRNYCCFLIYIVQI